MCVVDNMDSTDRQCEYFFLTIYKYTVDSLKPGQECSARSLLSALWYFGVGVDNHDTSCQQERRIVQAVCVFFAEKCEWTSAGAPRIHVYVHSDDGMTRMWYMIS